MRNIFASSHIEHHWSCSDHLGQNNANGTNITLKEVNWKKWGSTSWIILKTSLIANGMTPGDFWSPCSNPPFQSLLAKNYSACAIDTKYSYSSPEDTYWSSHFFQAVKSFQISVCAEIHLTIIHRHSWTAQLLSFDHRKGIIFLEEEFGPKL